MECPSCFIPFNNDKHVPRILIKCGHTLCAECIQSQFD